MKRTLPGQVHQSSVVEHLVGFLSIAVLSMPVLVFAGCGDDAATYEESTSRAIKLRNAGNPAEALVAARQAIRLRPDNPDARLLLAELYLDLGEGNLAATAINQALDRGLPPVRATVILAQALYLDDRNAELLALDYPDQLGSGERLQLRYLQTQAQARQSQVPDGSDDSVVSAFIDLFHKLAENAGTAEAREISADLEAARPTRPDIDRAWQHFACGRSVPKTIGWEPVDARRGTILTVGSGKEFETVAQAAKAAGDGDIVEIEPGLYRGDVALWPQDRLVIRGLGQRPVISADGKSIQRRDVWLFTGDDVVVENIEISGARSPWENGAGIRHTGSGLTLRKVYLHDNENGLLTGNAHPDTQEVLIEFSEFARNGDGKGLAHNIYIGRSMRFELRYSFSHDSKGGHLVKSRAIENIIAYNRLTDGEQGTSSYVIDIPDGGAARIVGNMIEQGPATLNHGIISFAGEGVQTDANQLIVLHNSIYNRDYRGIAVRNHARLDVRLVNNLFGGATVGISGEGVDSINNLNVPEHGMVDPRNYDYSLVAGARAVDSSLEYAVIPEKQYVHPVQWRQRQKVWRPDVGAFERCGI